MAEGQKARDRKHRDRNMNTHSFHQIYKKVGEKNGKLVSLSKEKFEVSIYKVSIYLLMVGEVIILPYAIYSLCIVNN